MLKLPGKLSAESFLARHWQKQHLFMPQALARVTPSVSRNELGWLATLDDVESRLIFTRRDGEQIRYEAETGPFDSEYLEALPRRDWTLLVHDVEKHLPAMRRLLANVPFVPDWRVDDLMVSFAAPGGGVGPHRDNYDVFLCQGIGVREWHVSADDIAQDPAASDDIALLQNFAGEVHEARAGDVLYLPPGVAHWGTAQRACITYSIGMRAPQLSDLAEQLPDAEDDNPFYTDLDLSMAEASAGYLSPESTQRAVDLLQVGSAESERVAMALGLFVTATKDWISPETLTDEEAATAMSALQRGARLNVHGMTRIAYDQRNVYANGRCFALAPEALQLVASICADRTFKQRNWAEAAWNDTLLALLKMGTFEIPEDL